MGDKGVILLKICVKIIVNIVLLRNFSNILPHMSSSDLPFPSFYQLQIGFENYLKYEILTKVAQMFKPRI
jgi:hypothetical protein